MPLRRLLLLLASALPAFAIGAEARTPEIDPVRLQAHVEFLASDLLEGRAAGTRGYDIAARYVASQLQQLGAKPAGEDGSWFQSVPLLEATPVIPAGKVKLERGGKAVELVNSEDFLPRAYFAAPASTVSAPLAYVGHAIHAPELGYDDFAHVDLKGKIAVSLSGAPPKFPNTSRAHYSHTSTKLQALVERGAVGWLFVYTPVDEKSTPWERSLLHSWVPSMRWTEANGAPFEAFEPIKVRIHLSRPGAQKLFAGAPLTLEQAFANSDAGRAKSFALPGTATVEVKNTIGRTASTNVVGLIEGSDEKLRNEYVVFTAHLDHVGRGAPVKGDAIYNGAMDNATGIAILLEMARYYASLERRPRRSLLFLAVTAEEKGLLGADYYARRPTTPRSAIVANINVDMPVALTELADLVAFGAEHSSLGPIAERATRAEGMNLIPDPMPEEVVFVRSDQYAFVKQGIPALYMDVGSKSRTAGVDGQKVLLGFLREHYHMPSDDTTQPINYPSLAALGRVNARIGLEVADADARPHWNKGDFFGERFARK